MLALPSPRISEPPMDLILEALSKLVTEPQGISREQTSESVVAHDRARILCIGDDPVLLQSRRLLLERDGYLVASVRSEAVVDEGQLRGFDLVVLCHSIPESILSRILEVLWRLSPETPVLLVSRLDKPVSGGPHYAAVSAHPVTMLGAVARQLALHEAHAKMSSQS